MAEAFAPVPSALAPDALRALLGRLQQVQAAIAAVARPAENGALAPAPVRLLAASKHQTAASVCALYDAGVHDFAENYVQEMADKAAQVAATGRQPRWHLVGALQRNKAAVAVQVAQVLHAIDSPRLVARLQALTAGRAVPLEVLVQVNLAAQPTSRRAGVAPAEVLPLAAAVLAASNLRLGGLMTVAPPKAAAAAVFAQLASLGQAVRRLPGGAGATALSMGMSGDFSAAIAAGATMVRIGSALFGPRSTTRG